MNNIDIFPEKIKTVSIACQNQQIINIFRV